MNDYKELIGEIKELSEEEKEFASNSGDIYRAEMLALAANAIEQIVSDYEILAKMYAKVNEDLCARTKERDAAVADLKTVTHRHNLCDCCKHCTVPNGDDCNDGNGCEWEWRGVQRANT